MQQSIKSLQQYTILVTGGMGYIGSHTVVQLLEAGANVVIIDNLSNSKREVLFRIQSISGCLPDLVPGDIRDRTVLSMIFKRYKIDAVFHFAGLKAVSESVSEPLKYYDNNVSGSVVLFDEMARAGVKSLVFSSSATVYGEPTRVPIKEDFPLKSTNPYGHTKLMLEAILAELYQADPTWSIAILRYFNPIGAHHSGLIGEDPRGMPNNLMPLISQVAVGKRQKISIFGNDFPTPDGTGVRDYIHVDDLALGHLAAIKVLQKPGLLTVNLGTGRAYSVLEIIHAFESASGKKVPYDIVARRVGDVPSCYADPTRAKQLLGWEARYDLKRMCSDAWRWQLMNPLGYVSTTNKKRDMKSEQFKNRNLLDALRNAWAGLSCLCREKAAVRELLLIFFSALLVWKEQQLLTLSLVLISLTMLVVEAVNTAIERLCDFMTTEYNIHIKEIKDLGAAPILILSLSYICIFVIYIAGKVF